MTQNEKNTKINDLNLKTFPIVGIGASAGGLEAFEKFFSNMPSDSGMAFILVPHLDPTHKSILNELIRKYTKMNVVEIEDGMDVKPNHAYIIPPNYDLKIEKKKLLLLNPSAPRGLRLPIDFFFRSLAEDQKEKAICIVLSGTGSDGTLGLREIKGREGMVMVQDPASAKYDGMPRSAINSAFVDYILPAEELPEHLIAFVNQTFSSSETKIIKSTLQTKDYLEKIFYLLRTQTGQEFSAYKDNTLLRRIDRRITITKTNTLDKYAIYLETNPKELELLSREFLIGVTNFFRDKEAFKNLQEKVIPELFKNKINDKAIRIWIPACSTGEEAYSIAILINEYKERIKTNLKVQIFGTDIDKLAIEKARQGIYPDGIAVDIPTEYIKKYFNSHDNMLHIKKSIRNDIVFATQNVITDPPFSKMDLISCRNLLIYLIPEIQKKMLLLFHYALNDDGFLFLGNSESITNVISYYNVVEKKGKIFQRKEPLISVVEKERFFPPLIEYKYKTDYQKGPRPHEKISYNEIIENFLLKEYAPPAVIITKDYEILYFHGRTGEFLEPSIGDARLNILDMARAGIRLELTTAIRKAISTKKDVIYKNLRIKTNGTHVSLNLIVKPILEPPLMEGLLMVLFEKILTKPKEESIELKLESIDDLTKQRIKQLEDELSSTKQYLQTTIEELETSNEELKSTNEELQSSNEELQSTNEELQTSKEELQSVNEELMTVNAELEAKIKDLSMLNNDLANLMESTEIGTVFLDIDLNTKRFTPAATKILNLINTDIGRPIQHISSNLKYDNLLTDIQEVLKSLIPKEIDVQDKNDNWYTMKVTPYRTTDNVIDGVVVTFFDITKRKEMERDLLISEAFLNSVIDQSPYATWISDEHGTLIRINQACLSLLNLKEDEVVGIYNILKDNLIEENGHMHLVNSVFNEGKPARFTMIHDRSNLEHTSLDNYPKVILDISIFPISDIYGKITNAVIQELDITEQIRASQIIVESKEKIQQAYNLANFYKDLFAHDMRNILQSMILAVEYYSEYQTEPEKLTQLGDIIEMMKYHLNRGATLIGNIRKLSDLIEEEIELSPIEISEQLNIAIENIRSSFKNKNIKVRHNELSNHIKIIGNELLVDIFDNILNNAVKFTDNEKEIKIDINLTEVQENGTKFIKIEFKDYGVGVEDERKKTLFIRSNGLEITQKGIGMGMGLSLVKKIVDAFGGKIYVEDRIKGEYTKGSIFVVLLKKAQ